jgi:hypothetical protein
MLNFEGCSPWSLVILEHRRKGWCTMDVRIKPPNFVPSLPPPCPLLFAFCSTPILPLGNVRFNAEKAVYYTYCS